MFQPAAEYVAISLSCVVVFPVAPATAVPSGLAIDGPTVVSQKELVTIPEELNPVIPKLAPGVTV